MINQTSAITFLHNAGANSLVLECEKVRYKVQRNGKTYESVNFNLEEDINGARLIIELTPWIIGLPNADFIADFFVAEDKQIVIDGVTIDVATDQNELGFDPLDGTKYGAKPKLVLKKKTLGIDARIQHFFVKQSNILVA